MGIALDCTRGIFVCHHQFLQQLLVATRKIKDKSKLAVCMDMSYQTATVNISFLYVFPEVITFNEETHKQSIDLSL